MVYERKRERKSPLFSVGVFALFTTFGSDRLFAPGQREKPIVRTRELFVQPHRFLKPLQLIFDCRVAIMLIAAFKKPIKPGRKMADRLLSFFLSLLIVHRRQMKSGKSQNMSSDLAHSGTDKWCPIARLPVFCFDKLIHDLTRKCI
jgi:hypothetical protein